MCQLKSTKNGQNGAYALGSSPKVKLVPKINDPAVDPSEHWALTLRRAGRHSWRPGLFYGAPRFRLQVIPKRRKMTPLEI